MSSSTFFKLEPQSQLSDEQISAASKYWAELLTGERDSSNPKVKVSINPDQLTADYQVVQEGTLSELDEKDLLWASRFASELYYLLQKHVDEPDLRLRSDYGPQDLLLEIADKLKLPKFGLFPFKTEVGFDTENNIIVNGVKISAKQVLEECSLQDIPVKASAEIISTNSFSR